MFKRLTRSLVLATALVAVTASATMAHECYVANRGSTGTRQAGTNSQAWIYVDLPSLAMFLSDPADPEALPALAPSQLDYFVDRASELGVPSELALFIGGRPKTGGFTLADNAGFNKNGHASDGSGVEHFFTAHFESVLQAYTEALQQPA
jgi:hypothetical protein